MKELNVREMRASIGRLDALVDASGELIVTRGGKAIARILPIHRNRQRPDHADLRARMPPLSILSEVLVRGERDER
jgi:antitoxin (DNA-binding transcriptional repressor) of toxin-antitoxin stability system